MSDVRRRYVDRRTCRYHRDKVAEFECADCRQWFCSECVKETAGQHYCDVCQKRLKVRREVEWPERLDEQGRLEWEPPSVEKRETHEGRIRIGGEGGDGKEAKKATKRILGGIAAVILIGVLIWSCWLKDEPLWDTVLTTFAVVCATPLVLGLVCWVLTLTPPGKRLGAKYPLIRSLVDWVKSIRGP